MSTYLDNSFIKHIKKNIDIIIECGSRDCLDAIKMLEYFNPEKIYSFECNPESINNCLNNIKNYPEIELIPKAVSNINGCIDFYITDMDKSIDKNIGASSALYHLDNKTTFFQKKINVESTTLDTFIEEKKIDKINLLCLDLQGYEKIAIEGLSNNIDKVDYIISEISFQSYYINDTLFIDYNKYLNELGFELLETLNYGGFGDALYKNKKL